MTRRLPGLLLVFTGALAVAAPPVKPAAKAKPDRAPNFFVGAGPATGWLPKVKNLPTADAVEKLAKRLSSRVRNVDPFGVATFPREDAAAPVLEDDPTRPTIRVTLNQALQTLKLNGVNLGQKEFLIGGRGVCEGDVIELSYLNENFQALVLEVGATEILFRDLLRDEVGVMTHNMAPKLQLEPMRNVSSSLESRWTPLEPATSAPKK